MKYKKLCRPICVSLTISCSLVSDQNRSMIVFRLSLKRFNSDSQEPMESSDVRLVALRCIVFELSACEYSAEFPAESGCKANDPT